MITEPYKFTSYNIKIHTEKFGEPIHIYPVGDVHRYCEFHAKTAFNRFLADTKKKLDAGEKSLFIGMGDEIEGMSRKERRALIEGAFHDETYIKLSKAFTNEINQYVYDTSFMVTHPNAVLIGGVEGNHRGVIRRSFDESWKNSCDYMYDRYAELDRSECTLANPDYVPRNLGGMTVVRVSINGGGIKSSVTICAVHGETIGGGRTKGGSINAVTKLSSVIRANIYLAGHNHDKQIASGEVLDLRTNGGTHSIISVPIKYVRTGCYRTSYVPDRSCYPARSAYPPSSIGTPELVVIPYRSSKKGVRIHIEGENV